MKPICKHCGLPIEKYGNKKEKMCFSCYQRRVNAKKHNKEYIKIIDLPEDEKQSVLAQRERLKGKNRKLEDNIVDKTYIPETINTEKEAVLKDIEQVFKSRNIRYPLEANSIIPVFHQLKSLFDGYNDYIRDFINAEDALNKMEVDYKHAKEHYSSLHQEYLLSNDVAKRLEIKRKKDIWEERHNVLLMYRREIKNVIVEYENGGAIILDLIKDTEFIDKFNSYYERLTRAQTFLTDGSYKAEASKLVESEDFCVGFKANRNIGKNRYQVVIKTNYLGNMSTFNRTVLAYDEESAKNQVIKFIKDRPDQFKFTWMSKDISVYKLSNEYSRQ